MGMFDTIHVKTPLLCPTCGAEILSLQTKELSDSMAHFKIGSVLRDSPVLTGIVQETLWCSACHEAQRATARWRRHYHDLHHDVQRWHEHLARMASPEPEPTGELAEKRRAFRRFFDLPEEILTAPDPLAAILAKNKHTDEEADD